MVYDQELQDDESDGGDASEDEANQLKPSHGKRKASSFPSLPIQRSEKKAKSTYKMPLHKAH